MNKTQKSEEGKRIRMLLEEMPLRQLLNAKQPEKEIVVVDEDTSIEETLKILAMNNILSIPVVNKTDQEYQGFVDVLDILTLVINMYAEGHQIQQTTWNACCKDIDTLSHRGVRFGIKPVKSILNASNADNFCTVSSRGTLYQLMEDVLYRGIHRVAVLDDNSKLIGIVSQSDIIQLLVQNIYMFRDLASKTVKSLALANNEVISMSVSAQAIHAYYLMYFHKVSAVAITNSSGALIANLSASDIKGLTADHFPDLLLPVTDYLLAHQGALTRPTTCTPDSTLESVILKLSEHRIHRVWILESDESDSPVIGVISLTDVIRLFVDLLLFPFLLKQ